MLRRGVARQTLARGARRGLSVVELMVGIAVGLFVVAAAAMLVSTQLNENRRLLLETQVQQDLRAATDIITRELRRGGHWQNAVRAVSTPASAAEGNPYSAMSPASAPSSEVDFTYWRKDTENGPYGFKLEGGVLKTRLGAGGWQDLTDGNALRVTAFTVTPHNGPTQQLPCTKPCAGGGTACWPTLTVREFNIAIAGQAVADPNVKRSLSTTVRLRNDDLHLTLPQVCPA